MSVWSGKVIKTSSRDWGTKTLYSWQFAGANLWFRAEFDPELTEEEFYQVEGDTPNKITSVQPVAAEAVQQAAEAQGEVPPTSSPDYWRWKQMHDLKKEDTFAWRDARADATRLVCAALDNDVLALGSAKGKKLDIILGMVNQITQQLVEANNNE
jgi:hypothetical protein